MPTEKEGQKVRDRLRRQFEKRDKIFGTNVLAEIERTTSSKSEKVDEEPPRKKRKYTKRKKAKKEEQLEVFVVMEERYQNIHDGEKNTQIEGIYTTMKEANKHAKALWEKEADEDEDIESDEEDGNYGFDREQEGEGKYVLNTTSEHKEDDKDSTKSPKSRRSRTSSRFRIIPQSRPPSKPSSPSASESVIENLNPFHSLRFQPRVVDRFPPLDHADTAILSTDTQLQFFCLPTGLFVTKCPSLPIFYCFVWTPESGEHLYGCCLRFFEPVPAATLWEFVQSQRPQSSSYKKTASDKADKFAAFQSEKDCVGYFAPKCLCLISYHPFIAGYRTFLTELYRLSLTPNTVPIERYLCNLFLECPLPPRGYFSAPTVFIIGTHKSLLLQIGDDLEDDILVVDVNTGSVEYGFKQSDHLPQSSSTHSITSSFLDGISPRSPSSGNNGNDKNSNATSNSNSNTNSIDDDPSLGTSHWASSQNVELPRHETQKLIRFLTPVSNLLYGAHQHDFHQLDLAFPVAPTPDMIEKQEQLQAQRLEKVQSHASALELPPSHHRKESHSHSTSNSVSFDAEDMNHSDSTKSGKKARAFSLSFKFKKPNFGMGSLRGRSDSIEPAVKSYTNVLSVEKNKSHRVSPRHLRRAQTVSNVMAASAGPSPLRSAHEKRSGNLSDIVESPVNAIFDDAAVRNGFLRFWLSIFRHYHQCIIHPQSQVVPPIHEDSATNPDGNRLDGMNQNTNSKVMVTSDLLDDGNVTTDDEREDHKSRLRSASKSKSTSSTLHSATGTMTGNGGQSSITAPFQGQAVDNVFDDEKFIKSSPSQSRPFLRRFLETEAFNRFIVQCVYEKDDPDVRFFNEKIVQKLGRSRFTKAQPTPFLSSKMAQIAHEFACPSPFIADLDSESKFIYPDWPKLRPSLYSKARRKYPKNQMASKSTTNKDITTNSQHFSSSAMSEHEPSITLEPSKSQTITSILTPPRPRNVTPHDSGDGVNDYDMIRESDEDRMDGGDIVLQLGDFSNSANPFSHDRVTYHLWFYLFLRTLQPPSNGPSSSSSSGKRSNVTYSQQRALHLMIRIMAQMKNENVGLPDRWVFVELIESMERMSWGDHVLKLVEVMRALEYKLDAEIYSSLLSVLQKQYGDLETAYNILGNLPANGTEITSSKSTEEKGHKSLDEVETRERGNSLMMNCLVKPESSRKKFYETIKELQNRFSATFPGRSIIIKQECPNCGEPIHDVHIRLGWSKTDQSFDTQCPNCQQRFDAKFLIKEGQEYRVWFQDIDSLKSIDFFRMRGDRGTFVERINSDSDTSSNTNTTSNSGTAVNAQRERENAILSTISVGDQIIQINGHDVSELSLSEIESMIEDPPILESKKEEESNDDDGGGGGSHLNVLQLPEANEPSRSISSSANYSDNGDLSDLELTPSTLAKKGSHSKARKLKKQTTKSKLMSFMKLNKENKQKPTIQGPICVTFRRVILCPYFSPLILYRETKKAIQNHALSLQAASTRNGSIHSENTESKSYRKQPAKKTEQGDLQKLLQQSGISAITSVEFRMQHFIIFWNLAWHFSNLRLPIHFLRGAFENEAEICTPNIDDLIQFVPLESASKKTSKTGSDASDSPVIMGN